MAKIKMYPVEFEIYLEGDDTLKAKFTAFDSASLSVSIDDRVTSSEELHLIADKLEFAQNLLEFGIKDEG